MTDKKKTNKVTCSECKHGVDVSGNSRVKLCDNPGLKTFGKNVKHGYRFSCGCGVMWNETGIWSMTVQEQKAINKKYFSDLGYKNCFPELPGKKCYRCTWDNGIECQCTYSRKDQWQCTDYSPDDEG